MPPQRHVITCHCFVLFLEGQPPRKSWWFMVMYGFGAVHRTCGNGCGWIAKQPKTQVDTIHAIHMIHMKVPLTPRFSLLEGQVPMAVSTPPPVIWQNTVTKECFVTNQCLNFKSPISPCVPFHIRTLIITSFESWPLSWQIDLFNTNMSKVQPLETSSGALAGATTPCFTVRPGLPLPCSKIYQDVL